MLVRLQRFAPHPPAPTGSRSATMPDLHACFARVQRASTHALTSLNPHASVTSYGLACETLMSSWPIQRKIHMKTSLFAGAMGVGLSFLGIASCDSDTNPRPGTLGSSSSGSSSSGAGGSSSSGSSSSSSSGEAGNGGSGGAVMQGHCTNGLEDGDEKGIDCGGVDCAACVGDSCAMATDCASQSCVNGTCVPPSCSDSVKNGTETDKDCGGPDCDNCPDNAACVVPEDCINGVCNNGICFPSSCSDGVSNGSETGIDCGGLACPHCPPGAKCKMGSDCISNACTMNICVCPPGMITASAPGNTTYCIDQVEVTNKAYVTFVNTPNLPPQETHCTWNATYVPDGGFPPVDKQYYPVANVDWCDAYAYCKAQGKHLCGGLGFTSVDFNASADASASIWYNACSGQAASVYPYGTTFNMGLCNGDGVATITPFNTMSGMLLPDIKCAGNFPALYHMSGNVAEWEDSCNAQTGANDECRLRGGSYLSQNNSAELACDAAASSSRQTTAPNIGFRCCQ